MRQAQLTAIVDMLVKDYGVKLTFEEREDLECDIEQAAMDAEDEVDPDDELDERDEEE